MVCSANAGGVLMPVPTAVPPSGSSRARGRIAASRSRAYAAVAAYPPSSWPRVTGVASMRWVRPDFTASAYSSALRVSASARTAIAWSSGAAASTAATWIALGKVSLDDWLALTTSFGWHSTPARSR